MFKKKKFYKITYKSFGICYSTIIEAKDEFQALRKFKRTKCHHSFLSIEKWKFGGKS